MRPSALTMTITRITARLRLRLTNGQGNFAFFIHGKDLHLYVIVFLHVIFNIFYVSIGHFRNVDEPGFAIRQNHEGTEMRNPTNRAFYDFPYCDFFGRHTGIKVLLSTRLQAMQ